MTDLRRRTVPRRLVAAGIAAQLAVWRLLAWTGADPASPLRAAAGLVCGSGVQLVLALVRPGALGFGDVTASALVGCVVGAFGAVTFVRWWLLMGVCGLLWLAIWPRYAKRRPGVDARAPFVPVIVAAGVFAVLAAVAG